MRQRCMRRFGFDLHIRRYDKEVEDAKDRLEASRRYGITDTVTAGIYGYGFPPELLPGPDHSRDGASAVFLLVLTGNRDGKIEMDPAGHTLTSPGTLGTEPIPPGGCVAEGTQKVLRGETDLERLGFQLATAAGSKAIADPEYASLNREWSVCMATAGYTRTRPSDIVARTDGEPAAPAEVHQALADIACKRATDYVDRFAIIHIKYQQQELKKNQQALADLKQPIDTVMERASRILALETS